MHFVATRRRAKQKNTGSAEMLRLRGSRVATLSKPMVTAAAVFVVTASSACSDKASYDNFALSRNLALGSSPKVFRIPLTPKRTLPNGNQEYEATYYGPSKCVVIYEFDAKTKRAVAWRIEGDNNGCRQPP